MKSIDEIKNTFKDLSDGVRILFLIQRKKEGGTNNKTKRHVKKIITTNSDEFFRNIEKLQELIMEDDRTLRIYASLNERDVNKFIREFKLEQLSLDYSSDELRNDFYLNLNNRSVSLLMKKQCKKTSNFLFDLDLCDDKSYKQIYDILEKRTEIITSYRTKNGWHIITKPFDYTKIDDERWDVHPDSLMLIDWNK